MIRINQRLVLALFLAVLPIVMAACASLDQPAPAQGPLAAPVKQVLALGTLGGSALPLLEGAQPTASLSQFAPAGDDTSWVEHAMYATVKIWIVTDKAVDGDLQLLGTCSGSVVDPSGLILTNWHCVGRTADSSEDDTGLGLEPGDTYHSQGLVAVGITEDPMAEPNPTYVAQVRQGSPELDFAVVRIVGLVDDSEKLPATLPLTVVELGDSDSMKVGDVVHVFGYPGIGGPLITKTKGEIAGFYKAFSLRPDLKVDSFKTDAMSAPGASGGLVTNDRGEQVGIHDFGLAEAESGARFGGEIFINLAKPYIEKARVDVSGPSSTGPGKAKPSATATKTPPQQTAATFGPIAFGTDYEEGSGIVGKATIFPTGTMSIVAAWTHRGMRAGTAWGDSLAVDGETLYDDRDAASWRGEAEGEYSVEFTNSGGRSPIPPGDYELVLYIAGKEAQRGQFTVGGKQATPVAAGVTLTGQVVDADTRRGVGGALVVVLQADVTIEQWVMNGLTEDLVASYGETKADGTFRADPPLARGELYSLAILAEGYEAFAEDYALEFDESDPATVKLRPIAIQQE